jgi:hypothetical protein
MGVMKLMYKQDILPKQHSCLTVIRFFQPRDTLAIHVPTSHKSALLR